MLAIFQPEDCYQSRGTVSYALSSWVNVSLQSWQTAYILLLFKVIYLTSINELEQSRTVNYDTNHNLKPSLFKYW